MSFSHSSQDVHLEGTVLHAECLAPGGHSFMHNEVDLNQIIHVDDSKLEWNHSSTALGERLNPSSIALEDGHILRTIPGSVA